MSETDLAWAAGFFDGEGNTGGETRHGGGYTISITQKERLLLDRFRDAVGEGKVTTQGKNGWQFYVTNRATVVRVMTKLWPYLGEFKRHQALSVLN